ncbi:MAG: 50S ribosomal protein L10 [bacterium]|nr:50S ribosomal protein L10 [bacterium]
MLTRAEKKEYIDLGKDLAQKSKALVFADFSGISTADIRKLKSELKKLGANFKVIKKRLLKLSLKEAGIDVDPTQFDSQVGTVFANDDLISVAAPIYKFSKELAKSKKDFKILGAYDSVEKSFLDADQFTIIAKLPSREVLLAQLVGMMAGSIRAFMYIVDQLSKKGDSSEVTSDASVNDVPKPAESTKETESTTASAEVANGKKSDNETQPQDKPADDDKTVESK